MAVQNQKGRFPKKWDKTGVVVENLDHDKVLVRMDGSRRLTTRNRRFVKKIISPRDLPDQNVMQDTLAPVMFGADEDVPTAQVDMEDTEGMGDDPGNQSGVQQQGMGQFEQGFGGGGLPGVEQTHLDDQQDMRTAGCRNDNETESPGRPQRTRRPNVKYSQEEYDLSSVSACVKQAGISGISARQVKRKDRMVLMSPEPWGEPLPIASGLGGDIEK